MKKVLLTLVSALMSLTAANAYEIGSGTGVYFRGAQDAQGGFNCYSWNELKYGDEDGTWAYLINNDSSKLLIKGDGDGWSFAVGASDWGGNKTLISAEPNQYGSWDTVENGINRYTVRCYRGGSRNAHWTNIDATNGTSIKAIAVFFPKDYGTANNPDKIFNAGSGYNFPADFADCGYIYAYTAVPQFIKDAQNAAPAKELSGWYLHGSIFGNNTDTSKSEFNNYPLYKDADGNFYRDVNLTITGDNDWIAFSQASTWDWNKTLVCGAHPDATINTDLDCFYGGSHNFELQKGMKINRIVIKKLPTNTTSYGQNSNVPDRQYAGIVRLEGEMESMPSNYVLEVWETSTNNLKWDTAGGLYQPFRTDSYFKNDTETAAGGYPLADRFKKEANDVKVLAFAGPMSQDEIDNVNKNYPADAPHAVKWASEQWSDDLGYTKAANTDLYMIDFLEGNDERGIYIKVPSVSDMTDESNDTKDVDAFYRMGVRFGFADWNHKGGGSDGLYEKIQRWVKWGHVFRLNEKSRPVGAFPVVENNKVVRWTDDFGTNEWNGWQVDANNGNINGKHFSDYNQDGVKDMTKTKNNKMGDSRLLAERPFWLKRIFLEVEKVGQESDGRAINRYWLYFDGEYDLTQNNSDTYATEFYVPANQDNAEGAVASEKDNYQRDASNIWFGSNLAAGEPGFNRFYNLDIDRQDLKNLIGIDKNDYLYRMGEMTRTGEAGSYIYTPVQATEETRKGNFLYKLDLRDSYTVISDYNVTYLKDGEKQSLKFQSGNSVDKTLRYKGQDGKFYQVDENGNQGKELKYSVENDLPVINTLAIELLYDSKNKEHTSATVDITSTYNLPNQAFPMIVNKSYDFNNIGADIQDKFAGTKLPLTKEEGLMEISGDCKYVDLNVNWDGFESPMGYTGLKNWSNRAAVGTDPYPVARYEVRYYADENETASENEADYTSVAAEFKGRSFLHTAELSQKIADKLKEAMDTENNSYKCYVHYLVKAWYDICYPTSGVLSPRNLVKPRSTDVQAAPAAGDTELWTPLMTAKGTGSNDVHTHSVDLSEYYPAVGTVSYRIEPVASTGTLTVPISFDAVITGVEGIAADEAPARYFDIHGFEVKNPTHGNIYIVRRGNKVSKQIF